MATTENTAKLPTHTRKTCELFRLLSGHELLGLAPGEIAKALGVGAPWVSVNLPALAAETGFVTISMIDFHGKSIPTFEHKPDSVVVVTTSQPAGLSGVYVILKPIAIALGLDWDSQRHRIMRDDVLSCTVITTVQVLPGDTQKREHLCLPIEFLNGWLFGISAKRVKPALRAFLKAYKLECYGVLYRHWHGKQVAPMVQSFKFWDAKRPHWADIARLALGGFKNKDIALWFTAPCRSTSSVGACLRRMYDVGYLNPVEVFTARLKPATAARWAIEKPVAAQWGRAIATVQQSPQSNFNFEFSGATA